jgi:hypothetical protein
MTFAAGLTPLRVRRHDDALRCDVSRVVGYVIGCDACGDHSPTMGTVHAARAWLAVHRVTSCLDRDGRAHS